MRTAGDDHDDDDGYAGMVFDDAFVGQAKVREAAADERVERLRRIDAEYRRLLDEQRARRDALEPAPRRRRWRTRLVVLALVVALGAAAVWSAEGRGRADGGIAVAGDPAVPGDDDRAPEEATPGHDVVGGGEAAAPGRPSPSAEQQPGPLGAPAPLAAESPAYRVLVLQPDAAGPIAYDPCRPIHLVVNGRTAPEGADVLLTEALAEVQRATGLQFTVDGPTDEPPVAERASFQPDRYGDRWAPVLVAWSDPAEAPELAGDTAGFAGSTWLETGQEASVYVSGLVALDGPQLTESLRLRGGRDETRAVIQHELAHLVGLDHVPDPGQLMQPVLDPEVTSFGAGDLTGLALLGAGQCFPEV